MLRIYILFLILLYTNLSAAFNDAGITVEGDQNLCNGATIPIVTSVTINGEPLGINNLDTVFIQITSGYNQNEDLLTLQGNNSNITSSWSAVDGELILTGPASFAEFENAISNVVFTTGQTNFTEDKIITIRITDVEYLPSTGHYYRYERDFGITWTDAKAAAEAQSLFGLQGYLATATSIEEARFIALLDTDMGWIGGSDQQQEGKWIWETGPEQGQEFWNGSNTGSSPNGAFALWNSGQPNNFQDEDYAHVTHASIGVLGSWNDLPNEGGLPNSLYFPAGYIVEFGGILTDPDINLVAEAMIRTPRVSFNNPNLCEPGNVQIQATTNTDQLLWFSDETATTPFNTGLTYDTFLNETTTFWVLPLFNNCTQGTRYPLTVNVFTLPPNNTISILQCDDASDDGITNFNLNSYIDLILDGNDPENIQVDFYFDVNLTQPIENIESFQNTQNPQIIYADINNVESLCTSTTQITFQVSQGNAITVLLETCDTAEEDGFSEFNLNNADNQILSSSPNNASIAYYESYNDALLQTNSLNPIYNNTEPYNQIIYGRVDIQEGCYAINEVNLKVIGLPPINDFAEVYYCLNTYPETITLDTGIPENEANSYSYNWSTNTTTSTIQVNEIGNYEVTVTDAANCNKQQTITVSASNIATIDPITVIDLTENNTIIVMASGEGIYQYALDNINGTYQSSSTFENVASGIHTIYVKDVKNNCGIVSESVSVIGYPKFFTPNNDTFNDTWQIEGYSSEFPVASTVQIFNRYGKLIASLNPQKPRWDGKLNNQKLPQGDYWFVAKFDDGREVKGHFTLKR